MYATKYTLSWSKKSLQNTSYISNIYRKFPKRIYSEIYFELEQKTPTQYIVNFRYVSEGSNMYMGQNTL